jgi:2,5-diamino-6-(ribosylamino)-4(3H)-pyrimidinone 5'-phosphate reductase
MSRTDLDHLLGKEINVLQLRAGLIDELSVIVAPVAGGRIGTPALFDVEGDQVASPV